MSQPSYLSSQAENVEPSPRRPIDRGSSVGIIVTNWNYGHFLDDCIASTLRQSIAPTEVIVVDDGSTDNSQEILAGWRDKITIVNKPNGGQASAFNAGFQKSTADIILFLDADDLLLPEALETILQNWHDDLTAVSFGLETIDFAGKSQGLYQTSLWAEDGDNRPRLLRNGIFAFAPTTGNAFNRRFLQDVLPMEEARWSISADLYLLSAAALHGRMAAIRHVLGRYRIHGGNSYYITTASQLWLNARGMADMAAAAFGFAAFGRLPAQDTAEQALLRLRLCLCGLEILCRRLEFFGAGQAEDISRQAWKVVRNVAFMRLPLRVKIPALITLALFATTGQFSETVRHWMGNSHDRTGYVQAALRCLGYRHVELALDGLQQPRWFEAVKDHKILGFGHVGKHNNILATGWLHEIGDGRPWSKGASARLAFTIETPAVPKLICFGVEVAAFLRGRPVRFHVTLNGATLWNQDITNEGTVAMDVPPGLLAEDGPAILQITCRTYDNLRQVLRERRPYFALLYFTVRPSEPEPDIPYLPGGEMAPFADFLPRDYVERGWADIAHPTAAMAGSQSEMTVSYNHGGLPLALRLSMQEQQIYGHLRIMHNNIELFSGNGPFPQELRLRLPESDALGPEILPLSFIYNTAESDDNPLPVFTHIGLFPQRTDPLTYSYHLQNFHPHTYLAAGQIVAFDDGTLAQNFLGEGWGTIEPDGVRNTAVESTIRFNIGNNIFEPVLELDVEPVLEALPGRRHLIAISNDANILTAAHIESSGILSVPLQNAISQNGDVSLTLHSVHEYLEAPISEAPISEAAVSEAPVTEATASTMAQFTLRTISLAGHPAFHSINTLPAQHPAQPAPSAVALFDQARTLVGEPAEAKNLSQYDMMRRKLVLLLWNSDIRLLRHIAMTRHMYDLLLEIGDRASGANLSAEESAIADEITALSWRDCDNARKLRVFLSATVILPSYRLPQDLSLASLPSSLMWHAELTARYLAQERYEIRQASRTDIYLAYVCRILRQVDDIFCHFRVDSERYEFACAILHKLNPKGLLFSAHNLAEFTQLRGRCIERHLSRNGCMLAAPKLARSPDGSGRIRVGVLVRGMTASPETWLLHGMYPHLNRGDFECILITFAELGTFYAETFAETLSIAHMPTEEAVAAIRGLRLDMFILGSFFFEFEVLSSIVAHRLAPLQILTSAISATTSGLRSFDYAISHRNVEPGAAQEHYTEILCWASGPFQAFDFSGAPLTQEGSTQLQLRETYKIAANETVFASGAMLLKIGHDLLQNWLDILAETPNSRLILYPYARNWEMPYPKARFEATLNEDAEAKGVDPARIVILEDLSPADVRAVLADADIYLDSYPYSGATTVVEALSAGTPVISLSGHSQRAIQGAYWLAEFGLEDLVTTTPEDYRKLAIRLAGDPEFKNQIQERLIAANAHQSAPYSNSESFGKYFSTVLLNIYTTNKTMAEQVS